MRSPFVYGSTVSKTAFTNRHLEITRLYGNLTSLINTIIISPRRWGKSSLVEHVSAKIKREKKDFRIVLIDLFSVHTEEEFLELFARKLIRATTTRWEDILKTTKAIFQRIIPRLSMAVGPGEMTIEFDREEILKNRDEILNLPEAIANQKQIKVVVCVDEFQNIKQFDKSGMFEKSLRSQWQRHKQAVYCLYGSKRHMMSDIFNDPSRPFYRFGDIVLLDKIETAEWVKFITRKFKRTKKIITSDQARLISQRMRDHSWYVQQYAHYTWLRTDKTVDDDILNRAFEEIKATNLPFFEQAIHHLSGTQINLLKAIADGQTQLTSAATMNNFKLGTPNNVRKNYKTLNEKDIVDAYEDGYIFLDPVFEYLFRERIINK